jgi:hypothetical protein
MPTYIDTILCEDVRPEIGNKLTLAGVFGEEMVLPQVPIAVPSFAIMQRWRLSRDEVERGNFGSFAFEIQTPQGQASRFPAQGPPPQPGVNVTTMTFIFKFMNMVFGQRGEYRFRTYLNDREVNAYGFYVLVPADLPAARQGQQAQVGRPPLGFHGNQ